MFPILIAAPAAVGLGAEYLCCRLPKRRWPRWVPPLLTLGAALALALLRYHGWSASGGEKAPLETLLFVPGLPAAACLLGEYLGWRLWRRLWLPRVVKDKKKKGADR